MDIHRKIGAFARSHGKNLVQIPEKLVLNFLGESIYGKLLIESGEDSFQMAGKAEQGQWKGEINNQTLGGRALPIFGFVQKRRLQQHHIVFLQVVETAFDKMGGTLLKEDEYFIEFMKMLKLHVGAERTLIVIEIVVQRILGTVDRNCHPLLVQQRLLVIHGSSGHPNRKKRKNFFLCEQNASGFCFFACSILGIGE